MRNYDSLPLVIFVSPVQGSKPEQWVGRACRANTLDLIARAAQVPSLGPIIVVTSGEDWIEELRCLPVEVMADEPGVPFHFGQRLRQAVERHGLSRLLYIGGGTGPLLTVADLQNLAEQGLRLEQGVLTNNLYSTDFAALSPASILGLIDLPTTDNDLAYRLSRAGVAVESLPATAATRLDLDTPLDLAIASLHPACGPALRRLVSEFSLDTRPLRGVLNQLHSPKGEVLVYGRISAATWSRLERLPCQTRVFSEERGMRASGRLARGEVRTWIGNFLQRVGPEEFFRSLVGSCTAAMIDTRPLLAHLGLRPSEADRFYSDLLQPEQITDPTLKALTAAAVETPLPLVLGGHSLVSGGLLALAEIAPTHP